MKKQIFRQRYLLNLQLKHINEVGQKLDESKIVYNKLKLEMQQLREQENQKVKKERLVERNILEQMKQAVEG